MSLNWMTGSIRIFVEISKVIEYVSLELVLLTLQMALNTSGHNLGFIVYFSRGT